MAVTIDEMNVEVQAPQPASAAPQPEPPRNVDLRQALELLQTRDLRLRAD